MQLKLMLFSKHHFLLVRSLILEEKDTLKQVDSNQNIHLHLFGAILSRFWSLSQNKVL